MGTESLRERKKIDTRRRIADAAFDLFEEQGYEATTLTQIADRADVSARTLFHYFPTKEALALPELGEFLAELATAFAGRPDSEPVLTSLSAAVEQINNILHRDPAYQQRSQRILLLAGKRAWQHLEEAVAEAIRRMVLERYAGDPDAEAKAHITASIAGAIVAAGNQMALARGGSGDIAQETERCIDMLHELLGAPEPTHIGRTT